MPLIAALYYMLPAYASNILPPLLKRIKFLDSPMDFGLKSGGRRLFGDHKTWRGFLFGTLFGFLVFYAQVLWTPVGWQFSLFDYRNASLWIGLMLSSGALIGDALKSFFKRRLNIGPGKLWFPFDQLDYVAGSILLASPWFFPSWSDILMLATVSLILTIIVKHIGFYLGVNKVKW